MRAALLLLDEKCLLSRSIFAMVALIQSHSERTMKKNASRDVMMNGTGTEVVFRSRTINEELVTRVEVHLSLGAEVQRIEAVDLQKEEIADSLKQTDQN